MVSYSSDPPGEMFAPHSMTITYSAFYSGYQGDGRSQGLMAEILESEHPDCVLSFSHLLGLTMDKFQLQALPFLSMQ